MRTLYDVGSKPSQEEEGEEEMDDNLLPPTETTFFFIDANISLFLLYERRIIFIDIGRCVVAISQTWSLHSLG